ITGGCLFMGNILLALVPAVMWGIQPLILQTIGGKTSNQQMGMSLGALIFSIGVLFFHQPVWSWHLIFASFVCGLAWAFGQITQIESFHIIGVSAAMPISTGMQLIGVTLFGIFYFHEWTSTMDYVYGISALVVIILGYFLPLIEKKVMTPVNKEQCKRSFCSSFINDWSSNVQCYSTYG
ncbi:GRP family sugar transporter, partial [Alicyclobacillus fastidiosus]|uniref:GRP family sugar transporter n=1 Tax=Alicyclobacillus fastidiosus TaxID=392011 RepID=UPI0024E06C70